MKRKSAALFIFACLLLAIGWILGNTLIAVHAAQQAATAASVGPAFTYQGLLEDGGVPANGSYDFQFSLHNAAVSGTQIGSTLNHTLVVTDGLFTVALDFGANSFNGDARFLEIAVQLNGGGGYTTLTPRQPISATPYASYADKVQPVGNIIVVAKSGGDFDDVSDALASITDATAANPYLIRIAPGVYIETGGIDLKSFVSVAGSGQGVTIIRGDGSNDSPYGNGSGATVRAGNITAELRHLTVESVATTNTTAVAIRVHQATNAFVIKHVDASARGGSSQTFGVLNIEAATTMEHLYAHAAATSSNSFAIFNWSFASPTMRHVTAESTSGTTSTGIRNQSSSNPIMIDVYGSGTGGVANYGLESYHDTAVSLIIRDSTFVGATASVFNSTLLMATPPTVTLISSQLDGPVNGDHSCLNSHNSATQPLDSDCQAITSGDAVTWDDVADVPADLLDGDDTGLDPANIVWVAKSGGDYTLPSAALSAITDATAENPYLIRIAPGIYTDTLSLKPYVSIEGSGPDATTIRNDIEGYTLITSTTAVIHANGPITAELRALTIHNYENGNNRHFKLGLTIENGGTEFTVSDLRIRVDSAVAFPYGIFINNASPTLNDVEVVSILTGNLANVSTGIWADNNSAPVLNSVTLSANGGQIDSQGISLRDSTITLNNVRTTGQNAAGSLGLFANRSEVYASDTTFEGFGGTSWAAGIYAVDGSTIEVRDSAFFATEVHPTNNDAWSVIPNASTVRLANSSSQSSKHFQGTASTWACRDLYNYSDFTDLACP